MQDKDPCVKQYDVQRTVKNGTQRKYIKHMHIKGPTSKDNVIMLYT